MKLPRVLFALCVLLGTLPIVRADDSPGHSRHGEAFDSGLRQRPWHMEGIGHTHFPITTQGSRGPGVVRPGQHPAPLLLVRGSGALLPLVPETGPGVRHGLLGAGPCGLNWFARGPTDTPELKRYVDFLKDAVRRKAHREPPRADVYRSVGGGLLGRSEGPR